jgi:hypothetical protein
MKVNKQGGGGNKISDEQKKRLNVVYNRMTAPPGLKKGCFNKFEERKSFLNSQNVITPSTSTESY